MTTLRMTTLWRQAAAILMLVGSVGLAAAQSDNLAGDNASAGASPVEPIGATGQTTPAKFSAENSAKDAIPLAVNDLDLSDADKRAIVEAVAQVRPPASTIGSGSGHAVTPPEPGSLLAEFFEMQEFPAQLTERLPVLQNHKYVALPDRVLLVNPTNRIVASEIKK